MSKISVFGLFILAFVLFSGCCGLEENRKSKEAALQTAGVLSATSDYAVLHLDPVKLATAPDGSFDKAACLEHSEMLELFRQDFPALAQAWTKWANGEEVPEYKPEEVDHEARCTP